MKIDDVVEFDEELYKTNLKENNFDGFEKDGLGCDPEELDDGCLGDDDNEHN